MSIKEKKNRLNKINIRIYSGLSNTVDTQSSVSVVESDASSTSSSATLAPSLVDRLKAHRHLS